MNTDSLPPSDESEVSKLKRGLQIQLRVIHALMFREMRTRFGKYHLGYLWALIEPIFWIAAFYGMFHFTGFGIPYGMDLPGFIVTGIIPFMLYRETQNQVLMSVEANKPLLYYPNVMPIDLAIGRTLLEFATMSLIFILLMAVSVFMRGELVLESVLNVIFALVLASLLGLSIGLFFSSVAKYLPSVERVIKVLMRPMLWVSGIFYTVNDMPLGVRELLLYNPVIHIVEFMRDAWYPTYTVHYAEIMYPVMWIVLFGYFGIVLERRSRNRIRLV
jgi:capsular polysaccharide transport system permease protein